MTAPVSTTAPLILAGSPWYRRELAHVLALGLATEVALIVGLAWPLWIGRRPVLITQAEPLAAMLGQNGVGLTRFIATLAVWAICFVFVLRLGSTVRTRAGRMALYLLPILFCATLLPTLPAASKDAYHYVMEGRLLAVHGLNPLVTPPARVPDDALYWSMSSWEDEPARYGPLWVLTAAMLPQLMGDSLTGSLLLLKLLLSGALLGAAWLTSRTVGRDGPGRAQAAWTLLAWNPLLLFEAAANGHNDLLMVLWTAVALYAIARARPDLGLPALALAALTKFTTGLIGPLVVVWAWRRRGTDAHVVRRLVVGLAVGAALTVLAYAPLWAGAETFRAVGGAANDALNSPGWAARAVLERLGMEAGTTRWLVSVPLVAAFGGLYATAVMLVARGVPTRHALYGASVLVMVAYIITIAWWFWPWYVLWVVPLAALHGGRRVVWLAALWSLCALAAYIPITYRLYFWGPVPDAHMPLFVLLTVFVPVSLAGALLWWRDRRASAVRVWGR